MKIDGDNMSLVFQALAHGTRRQILDIVKATPGCSVGDVTGHFEVSRIAVMKHLNVLEDAGLLVSTRDGRTRRLYVNAVPLQQIHERWTTEWGALWAAELTDLKRRVESRVASDVDHQPATKATA